MSDVLTAYATRRRVQVLFGVQLVVVAAFALGYNAYDFHIYQLGGHAVLHDAQLYKFRWRGHGFTYPPFAATIFAPFQVLPAGVARLVWDEASVLALAVAIRATALLAGRRLRPAELTALTAAALFLEPVWHTLFLGQVNLLLLAAVLVDVERIARGRTAGIGIGLAAAIKLTPGIFILLLLLAGRRRSAGVAVGTVLAATGFGAVVAPHASWAYWTGYVTNVGRVGRATYASNQSIHGALARASEDAPMLTVLLPVAVCVMGLLVAARLARQSDWLAAAATAGVTSLLVSPISWSHHWVWAVPAIAVLIREGRPARAGALAATAVFVLAPNWWPLGAMPALGSMHVLLADAYGVAGAVFCLYAARLARRPRVAAVPHRSEAIAV